MVLLNGHLCQCVTLYRMVLHITLHFRLLCARRSRSCINSLQDRFLYGPRIKNDRKKKKNKCFMLVFVMITSGSEINIQHCLIVDRYIPFARIIFRSRTYALRIFYYAIQSTILYTGLGLMSHQPES